MEKLVGIHQGQTRLVLVAIKALIRDNKCFFNRGARLNPIVLEPEQQARACVIWMHGLGASADDMAGLAEQLPLKASVRHVALNAPIRPVTLNGGMPMPAWYDITGMAFTDREDEAGINASKAAILEAVDRAVADGFLPQQIFLAGFSQGGAMALFTALSGLPELGGVIALSAYLPLAAACDVKLHADVPFFIASGRFDPLVLPAWTTQTVAWLRDKGLKALTVRDYPMEHAVCMEEIQDIAVWLEQHVTTVASEVGDVS